MDTINSAERITRLAGRILAYSGSRQESDDSQELHNRLAAEEGLDLALVPLAQRYAGLLQVMFRAIFLLKGIDQVFNMPLLTGVDMRNQALNTIPVFLERVESPMLNIADETINSLHIAGLPDLAEEIEPALRAILPPEIADDVLADWKSRNPVADKVEGSDDRHN